MSRLVTGWNGIQTKLLWAAIIALGTVSFAIVALTRGESVNVASLVIAAAVCIYFVSYRFYGSFVANKVLGVDARRQTPAYRHNDGFDYAYWTTRTARLMFGIPDYNLSSPGGKPIRTNRSCPTRNSSESDDAVGNGKGKVCC